MNFLKELISSIQNNAKLRVNDPLIGTFIVSWCVCNWNYLVLLFWGEGKLTERVSAFYIYLSETPFFEWNCLFLIPFSIVLFYLFVFPWVTLGIKFLQRKASDSLYEQTLNEEILKANKQEELNKVKLRSSPNKHFLEQVLEHELDKKNEILEHIKQRKIRLEAKAKEAIDKAKEQEALKQESEKKNQLTSMELDKKTKQNELERAEFAIKSAIAKSTLASQRFPAAYHFMSIVSNSLEQDNIRLSLKSITSIVTALFGYDSFEDLISDINFHNESIAEIKFIYYDDELVKRLEDIVIDESSENEDLSSEVLFGHLQDLFNGNSERNLLELVNLNKLDEYSMGIIENDRYSILNEDGVSGAIADSDTTFDEIENINLENSDFNAGYLAKIVADASGYHRRDSEVPGRTMSISVDISGDVILGKYGLSSLGKSKIQGVLDDFD